MPGKGALLGDIAKYAAKSAGHGAVQGAVGAFPRHQAAQGNLWNPSEWELPSTGEVASQTAAGAYNGWCCRRHNGCR